MLDTTVVFKASAIILILLLLLCCYLLINNRRAHAAARRKAEYIERNRATWERILFETTETKVPELEVGTTEEVDWTIELFLSYFAHYQDPETRARISALADALFAARLRKALASRSRAVRQYGLAVIYQLHMTSLGDEVSAVRPRSELETYLQAGILPGGAPLQPVPRGIGSILLRVHDANPESSKEN